MNNQQQLQAKNLYFQTDLSKTQIAGLVNVPRRTLHYWIKEKNWDRLKNSAAHMPSLLAENCYHIIARFSEQLLSEDRIMRPITHQEADTLHKLTLTVNKLKNRSTINESMEMFGYFMESVNRKSPELAKELVPFMDEYMSSRAAIDASQFRPDNFNSMGLIPAQQEDTEEKKLDFQDVMEWTESGKPSVDIEQFRDMDAPPIAAPPITEVVNESDTDTAPAQPNSETTTENSFPDAGRLAELHQQMQGLKRYKELFSHPEVQTAAPPPENIRSETEIAV